MGMVHDNGNAVPFHGDHHPVKVATCRNSRNLLDPSARFETYANVRYYYPSSQVEFDRGGLTLRAGKTYTLVVFPGNYDKPSGVYFNKNIKPNKTENLAKKYNSYTVSYTPTLDIENVSTDAYWGQGHEPTDVSSVRIMVFEGVGDVEYEPYGLIEEPIFEPTDQAQDGKTLTFENTYNDVAEVTVFGESMQKTLTGKNLVDYASAERGYIGGDRYELNAKLYPPDSTRAEKTHRYIGIKPSTDYTLRMKCGLSIPNNSEHLWFCVVIYQTDGSYFIVSRTHDYGENERTITFATKPNTYAVAISWRSYESEGEHFIQLEAGSTATEYEPYCGGIPSPNPDYPQPIESIKSVELVSSNADGSKSATRTIDLQGHELRSLPDGTHDEVVVHSDGTVELVLRCDASMFDPSYQVSSEWKLATPRIIQLPSIDQLPTYHPYTVVYGNGADISARVRVFE